jgi:hypothetical protein
MHGHLPSVLLLCHSFLASDARWNTASVLQPPSIPFVSLLDPPTYDNTTCAGRCCKRVEVSRAPDAECRADWRACAQLSRDSTAPRCGEGFPCTAWVPCEDHGSVWKGGLLALLILTVLTCIYLVLRCGFVCCRSTAMDDYVRRRWALDVGIFLALVITAIYFGSAIVIAWDYQHFAQSTEMQLDFVSYQHCTEYCNHRIQWETDYNGNNLNMYSMFYCRDAKYNLTGFDLFPANRNQRPGSSECPSSWTLGVGGSFEGWYCSSCFERRGDWVNLNDISKYNEVRGYVFWSLLLGVSFLGVLMHVAQWLDYDETRMVLLQCMLIVLMVSAAGHLICVALDSMFLYNLDIHPGAKITSGVVNSFDALGFYRASIFVDLVGFAAMVGLGNGCLEVGCPLFRRQNGGGFYSNMGATRIEPRDVIGRRSVV